MSTELQKKATAKIVEAMGKPGKVAVSRIMKEVGYSPHVAKSPAFLTETQGYKEELAKYGLTEDRYYNKIDQALDAKKWNDFTGEREPDYKTQLPYHTKLGKLLGVEKEQEIQNNIIVAPILGGDVVYANHSDQEVSSIEKEDQGSTGGDISQQDNIDTLIAD